ncbi:carbohydrate-binding protein [Pseudochryseolinea flava]|uniref:Glycoside hydrolase family 5 n=1 Tax=Pseudochryseolinea flava TaxID=2059302 RepID=A0A364XW32_9BACT|nr:carbohydrate-binding protein [Pseudochryseolinea flava]RAV98333.1 glycoside hydrolase family 5 [Pseudochryseolinea flava]
MKKPLPISSGHCLKTPTCSTFSIIFTLTMLFSFPLISNGQYLHRSGKKIVDGDGKEIILRGMGLGGWMLQEGYMLETSAFANPQHEIRERIVDVVGEANTVEFYDAWLANHVTERDIDSLAAWGFNSVRLPMHYNLYTLPIEAEPVAGQNTWLTKGFELTDKLLQWCEKNEMYLILDLHAAPGGQGKDAGISDYDKDKPSLWESEANKQKTIALWKKLAERYATKKWIGGYDLINETNWAFTGDNINGCNESTNVPLRTLLIAITNAIREVDANHLIFIEGNCWANNHNGLWPRWDENIAASFHKYWNYNDQGSIQGLLNLRDAQDVPLWMGESGENSNTWFTNAIKLLEENHIGWSWWPLKKVGGVNSSFSVEKKSGYSALLSYWQTGSGKPSVAVAKASLMELAEGLKIDNTLYRKDIADAMIRQVNTTATIPYTHHVAPGVVPATDFDLGRNNFAYADKDTANYHVATQTYTAWNTGWAYRNDGVDIQPTDDKHADANGYNIGWTEDGEWMQYTIDVDSNAGYNVVIRYAAASGNSQIQLTTNGNVSSSVITLPSTGGYSTYQDATISDIILPEGFQKIRLKFIKGGANLSFLKFVLSKKVSDVAFLALTGESDNTLGNSITLTLNKKVDASTLTNGTGFTVKINGNTATIQSITDVGNNRIKITLDQTFTDADNLRVSYNSDVVKSEDAKLLNHFTDLSITNALPFHFAIPTRIEAERFTVNNGLQLETTTDTGGGQNLGYTNVNDYVEYRIRVAETGHYPLKVRVASNGAAGKLKFTQHNSTGAELNSVTVNMPVTGGWQSWTTVNAMMDLEAGTSILRVSVLQPEFNLNWYEFGEPDVISSNEEKTGSLNLFPNPTSGELYIDFPKEAYSLKNSLIIRSIAGTSVRNLEQLSYENFTRQNVADLSAGLYIVEFSMNGKTFRSKVILTKDK